MTWMVNMTVSDVLDAVDAWATPWWMIRETGIVDIAGRLDALLVPVRQDAAPMTICRVAGPNTEGALIWFWERPRLAGIEVKLTRADFLRGLREGQYARYRDGLCALYVAAPKGVCKRNELPDGVGLLQVSAENVLPLRAPRWQDVKYPDNVAWRLIWAARKHYASETARVWKKYRQLQIKLKARQLELAPVECDGGKKRKHHD